MTEKERQDIFEFGLLPGTTSIPSALNFVQNLRLQLVLEFIRAGRIDDCLSLAHGAEQFVLNGMENKTIGEPIDDIVKYRIDYDEDGEAIFVKDADGPCFTSRLVWHVHSRDGGNTVRPTSSWPQTKEEVVSDPSIQAKFNEKWKVTESQNGGWYIPNPELDASNEASNKEIFKKLVFGNVEAPIAPSQEEVNGGGESTESQMTLWDMCEAIIVHPDPDNLAPDDWILTKDNATGDFTLFQPQCDGDAGAFTIVADLEKAMIKRDISIREILMRFPPFKK